MLKENSAALFIRLLTQAHEADRLIPKTRLAHRNKAQADTFKQQQLAALYQFKEALEPLDCVQLMGPDIPDRPLG
ncbi:MAG: hypothetical protein IKG52_07635 [Rhodobacteraceae bacterium]|nr:hypothetical protein [Paracoccaceae bacterium]